MSRVWHKVCVALGRQASGSFVGTKRRVLEPPQPGFEDRVIQNSLWTRRKSRNAARAVSHPQPQVPEAGVALDLPLLTSKERPA
jgi:hypothetical protein